MFYYNICYDNTFFFPYNVFWLICADSIELPPEKSKPWWLNEKVKLKLCTIYRDKAMVEEFVDAIFPLVRESLYVETLHPKVIMRNHSKHTHVLSLSLSLSHTHTHIQTHQDVYYWCKKIKSYPNHCCHVGEMILLKD